MPDYRDNPPMMIRGLAVLIVLLASLAPGTGRAHSPNTDSSTQAIIRAGEAVDLTQTPTDLWDRVRAGFAMPDLHSPLVLDRQAWYAARPAQLRIMFERSRRYLFHIVEELERRGMPTELALLPMVESAFNPMAYSSAKASGLWQFIPSTGRTFRLDQDWWHDGRRDIVASTSAALDYLQNIYEMNGDWHLALASYNWGENAVARAIERNRAAGQPIDFNSLQMPNETRWYVPKLQALKNIVLNPTAFGIDIDPIPNAPYFATVQLNSDIDLDIAAQLAEMPLPELIALNPANNRPMVSAASDVPLVIPADKLERFLDNVANYDQPLSAWDKYSARQGEKLDAIASRFNTTVAVLRAVNGIQGSGQLRSNVELLVPRDRNARIPEGLFKAAATISAEPEVVQISTVAKQGDTWASMAARLRVQAADLQRWNRNAKITAGHSYIAYRGSGAPTQVAAVASTHTAIAPAELTAGAPGKQSQRVGSARTVQATVKRAPSAPPPERSAHAPVPQTVTKSPPPAPKPVVAKPAKPGKQPAVPGTHGSQG